MEPVRFILHIDMDAFYASVEVRDNPSLQGKPVLVGASPKERGVVAACSYEARKFGIHSAMPMSQAIRLCPQAIVSACPNEPLCRGLQADPADFFHVHPGCGTPVTGRSFFGCVRVHRSIWQCRNDRPQNQAGHPESRRGLTASVGIAPNKFLAKLASDLQKPDGFVVITEETKQQILDPLPVSKIWGIGKVTNNALQKAGIKTIKELRTAHGQTLSMLFGNQVEDILNLAQGIDDRKVEPDTEAKEHLGGRNLPDRYTG